MSKSHFEIVASNGIVYGPAALAIPWGNPDCPVLSASLRSRFKSIEVPLKLARVFGRPLTYDELDSGILGRSNLDSLPMHARNIIHDMLSDASFQPLNDVLIPNGVTLNWLQALPLQGCTKNAIVRAFMKRGWVNELQSPITVSEFLSIRGVRPTALNEVLCVMESAVRRQESNIVAKQVNSEYTEFDPAVVSRAVIGACLQRMKELSPLLEALQVFAEWAQSETDAENLGDAVIAAVSQDAPGNLWNKVAETRLATLSMPQPHPYEILDVWAGQLQHREAVIFKERICTQKRVTLQELAQMLGVSRERVRQIEAEVLVRLRRFLTEESTRPIHWRAETLRRVLGVAGPCRTVENLLVVPANSTDYRTILLDLAGPYVVDGEWLINSASRLDDPTDRIRMGADEFGRIDLERAASDLSAWGLDTSFHREWLTRNSTIREFTIHEFNGTLVCWGKTIGDRLAFALADLGRPATVDELMEHIQEERTRSSARNALGADARVVKVGQAHYALKSWGLQEFQSIAYSTRDAIQEAGHPLVIDELVDRISGTFGVAEASVRQYIHAPIFVVEGDTVRLRTKDEPFRYPRGSIRSSSGVFALGPSCVALMRRVDADMLRGSGRTLPHAAGDILKVEVNREIALMSAEGDRVVLTYPETSIVGPSIGSVRALVERLSAKVGDFITLVMDRSDMSVVARLTQIDKSDPSWGLVSRLTGIDAHSGMDGLAQALHCDRSEVRSVLRSRGDEVVLDALPAQSTSSNLALALAELGDQISQSRGRTS